MPLNEPATKAYKITRIMAFSYLASLTALLVIEEIIRSTGKPFLGFAWISVHLVKPIRIGFFLLAALIIILIRLVPHFSIHKSYAENQTAAIKKLKQSYFVILTLAELPGLFGFILFLFFGLNIDFYILILTSYFLTLMFFPRASAWQDALGNN